MQKAKNILVEVWLLLIHIILTAYLLLKKIVLPGRNRKGNVLGSLFLFFITIAEKLIVFEQNILNSSWLIKNRFVKQGLIIASAFLFLISSVEWTAATAVSVRTEKTETIECNRIDKGSLHISAAHQVRVESQVTRKNSQCLVIFSPPLSKNVQVCLKRFLLLGNLRI